MHFLDVNFVAVIVSAILYMGLGFLWYSPKVLGPQWLSETKFRLEDMKCDAKTLGLAFVNSLVMFFALAHFVKATNSTTFWAGLCVGFWAWLGFVATTHFSGVLWEKRPLKLMGINIAVVLIGFLLLGGLLAVWK